MIFFCMKNPPEQRPRLDKRLFILSADTVSTMSRRINPLYVEVGICVSIGKREALILLMRM